MYPIKNIELKELISTRKGEIKAGEKLAPSIETADFVIFGIEEDLGVRENYGHAGAKNNWEPFLKALLNTQYNRYNSLEKVFVLGSLMFDPKDTVEKIDLEVSKLNEQLAKQGKIPIAIGGGHNNAFGMIKGCSSAYGRAINVLNFDAHSDFRQLEHRHSGNGFSYAFDKGFISKYCVFGLHENYTPEYILSTFEADKNLKFVSMETLIDNPKNQKSELNKAIEFTGDNFLGLEVDLDCISHINSSAMTPSGFEFTEFRSLFRTVVNQSPPVYLHLCEGITDPRLPVYQINQVAKVMAYLVTDFIKMFKSVQNE